MAGATPADSTGHVRSGAIAPQSRRWRAGVRLELPPGSGARDSAAFHRDGRALYTCGQPPCRSGASAPHSQNASAPAMHLELPRGVLGECAMAPFPLRRQPLHLRTAPPRAKAVPSHRSPDAGAPGMRLELPPGLRHAAVIAFSPVKATGVKNSVFTGTHRNYPRRGTSRSNAHGSMKITQEPHRRRARWRAALTHRRSR
jgi:hypothetical protein